MPFGWRARRQIGAHQRRLGDHAARPQAVAEQRCADPRTFAGLHAMDQRHQDRRRDQRQRGAPREQRDDWPLVVSDDGDGVVCVPGIVSAPGYEDAVEARRDP